jgi:hypothetical protein
MGALFNDQYSELQRAKIYRDEVVGVRQNRKVLKGFSYPAGLLVGTSCDQNISTYKHKNKPLSLSSYKMSKEKIFSDVPKSYFFVQEYT